VQLTLSPLRDKLEDIPLLLAHFQTKLGRLYGGKQLTFEPAVLSVLSEYLWPGNVRELENLVESLLALVDSGSVALKDLPTKLFESSPHQASGAGRITLSGARPDSSKTGADAQAGSTRTALEREDITKALKRANYSLPRTAELLGVSPRVLRYQMQKLGISDLSPR